MPNQGRGAPFLERTIRTGKKWSGLMGVDYPGGMGSPSPNSIGGTAAPPPRPVPSGEQVGMPLSEPSMPSPEMTAPTPAPTPLAEASPAAQPGQPASDFNFPSLSLDIPGDSLYEADPLNQVKGNVLPAITLSERFYRRYGRMPGPLEGWLNSYRNRFEKQMGRPPTRVEVENMLSVEDREDEAI